VESLGNQGPLGVRRVHKCVSGRGVPWPLSSRLRFGRYRGERGHHADISEPQRSTHGGPSDKGDKPIIDITGEIARETFGKTSHVIVSYRVGRITIKSED
jgi:hypothetical protein